jgi:dipeptidyl aminopeptidase/acylaminoacyl peptidase
MVSSTRGRVARGVWMLAALLCTVSAQASPPRRLEIDDYFRLARVTELALSSDAKWLAYTVESYSAEQPTRAVFVRQLAGEGREAVVGTLADASELAWIPGTHELAFLAGRSGSTQVFSYDVASGRTVQRTASVDAVEKFRFAPDGAGLAFLTRPAVEATQSLYEQFKTGTQGIPIDPRTTSSHDFLNPHWQSLAKRPPATLWIKANGTTARVAIPGEPAEDSDSFFWSSDSKHLSLLYVGDDVPASLLKDERTSLGVFDLDSRRLRILARASAPAEGIAPVTLKGGEWVPGSSSLLLRRIAHTDPWISDSFAEWTIVDGLADAVPPAAGWHALEGATAYLRLVPIDRATVLAENTLRAVRSLFRLTPGAGPQGMLRDQRLKGLSGSSSLFRFSADFSTMVFVNESLTRPPEIYLQSHARRPRALTRINAALAAKLQIHSNEVMWTSDDGIQIAGWLIEPDGKRPAQGWPLVTHVHGGPAFAYPDAFAPYFRFWPYPLEVYPSHGIAVFLPNYRGTHSYGREVATSTSARSAADIVTGVEYLVRKGIADPQRLGISGHSHGAVVGPLAMARARKFSAASFAEGVANAVVMYELMSDDANREIHDVLVGTSLYENPQRYVAESPDLQFSGLRTAALFEGGAQSAALLMLGYPKAAARAGMPTEFIIYPQTGHNVVVPTLQREAAQRNLDWFEFWLLGREDALPSKATQYARWRTAGSPH